jgi:S1-C subfamily serine protease
MARTQQAPSQALGMSWLVILLLICATVFLVWRNWPSGTQSDPEAKARPIAPAGEGTSEEKTRIDVFGKAKASVVNISSAELRRDLATLNIHFVPKGSGTGFIWDEQGRVVTNYHVVEGAKRVLITLDDHTTANVSQIRYDKASDLAVLWTDIPSSKRKPIAVGESSKLQVGQSVLAIGNPFGLDHSLSAGIISSLSRNIKNEDGRVIRGLIQTDAAINPGNSGGPLLDSSGRLIGMNTAILSPSGANAGIGFAIPVDIINRMVPRLIAGATNARPGLGIVEAPAQWAKARGIVGVLILDVIPDGPADKAQLRATRRDEDGDIIWGDIITAVDDHKVRDANELYAILADNYEVGQKVTVHFQRDGEERTAELMLGADVR